LDNTTRPFQESGQALTGKAALSKLTMLGWAAGSHGSFVMIGILSFFLLNYMTDNLGISISLAGQIIFLARMYDLITDPIMGTISDRTQTSMGRRRPYLLLGAFTCFACFVLLFNAPDFGTPTSAAIYITIILLLYSTAYTIFNVPHLAMPAEMTTDYHTRTTLTSFRTLFFITALLTLTIAGSIILDRFGEKQGYAIIGWAIGATVFATMLISFFATKNTTQRERTLSVSYSVREQIEMIWQNRHFCIFLLAKTFLLTANASFSVAFLYFAKYAMDSGPQLMSRLGIWQTLGTLASIPLWIFISRRIGKRNALIVTSIGYSCIMLTWLLASPEEPDLIFNSRIFVIGIFTGGIITLGFALLPDTIAYDRLKSGLNRGGVYSGIYSTMEKVASGLGTLIFSTYLAANGYTSSQAGEKIAQSDATVDAIYYAVGVFPALAVLTAAFIMVFYRLNEDVLTSMSNEQTANTDLESKRAD